MGGICVPQKDTSTLIKISFGIIRHQKEISAFQIIQMQKTPTHVNLLWKIKTKYSPLRISQRDADPTAAQITHLHIISLKRRSKVTDFSWLGFFHQSPQTLNQDHTGPIKRFQITSRVLFASERRTKKYLLNQGHYKLER